MVAVHYDGLLHRLLPLETVVDRPDWTIPARSEDEGFIVARALIPGALFSRCKRSQVGAGKNKGFQNVRQSLNQRFIVVVEHEPPCFQELQGVKAASEGIESGGQDGGRLDRFGVISREI
jgi:hypothetical protein